MNDPAAPVREHQWGDAPDLYGPRHDYREDLIMRRLRRLHRPSDGARALDAGAGAGSMALRLAREGYRVTATDASRAFAELLAQRLATAPGGPHRALQGDMSALPVEDATMDVAVCAEVLEHLDDDAGAVRQLARVLRPGGLLVVTVPAGPHRMDWTDTWAGHRRRYAAPQLTELLRAGGFVRVDVRGWGFPLTGLYHRHVYAPMLRRRVDAGRPGLGGGAPRGAARILRMALELDTPFIGRAPGWFGLLATARRA